MDVLAPVDGSECSFRALRFATEFARRYGAGLHVIHVTDLESERAEAVLERAEAVLDEEGILDDPEFVSEFSLLRPGYADRIGENILEVAREDGYDHVVMGHHGKGAVDRLVLGSAAETVVRAAEVPATIVP